MKKLNLLVLFFLAAVTAASAQTNTRSFDLRNFEKLSMGSAFKITVKQGERFRVVASGEQEDLDDLEAKVSGGTLSVKYKVSSRNRKGVSLDIEMPSLSGIDLSGAASMKASGFTRGRHLDLDVSGAARLVLDTEVETVNFDFSGASSITLTGKANSLKGDISGASSLKAADFPVKEADVDASGASSAFVNISSKLLADASGASSIRYTGGAQDIRMNTSGGSSVRKGN